MESLRILIVDDHPIVRRGLVDLFSQERGMSVVGEAASAAEAIALARTAAAHVAIVDLFLGNDDGLALVAALTKAAPATHVLVLSSHDAALYARRTLNAGARGFIMKDQSADELVTAVRRVGAGRTYLSATSVENVLASLNSSQAAQGSNLDHLSNRERHVFVLLGRGLATREIARQLKVSVKTVETHCAHLKEKLGVRSGRELMRVAFSWAERR